MATDRALVATVDFITPIVDDPYTWGQIAAANAASDIYAMGGEPIFALNLVNWNSAELPSSLLVELLTGANDKAAEGGWIVVGGHSIEDPEPKYGMCVVGEADPSRLLKNTALRPGDSLILTKPIGAGILTTAIKRQLLPSDLVQPLITSMCKLNKAAKDIALRYGAEGATDVTGFGLLGHLGKMLTENRIEARLNPSTIPVLEGAREMAIKGITPSGSKRNLDWIRERVITNGQDDTDLMLLADAQTSGGLLFGVGQNHADDALRDLTDFGYVAAIIGSIHQGSGKIALSPGHVDHF